MQREPDASDQRRLEAARQTVWAVAAAFKSIRLYSPGHTLVQKAIDHAVTVLKSYGDRFGSLVFTVVPRGVVVESSPQPVEDEVVNELARPAQNPEAEIRIGMPSGILTAAASVRKLEGQWHAEQGAFYRTQRRMFEGQVLVRASRVPKLNAARKMVKRESA